MKHFIHIHGSFAMRIGYFEGFHEILTELLRKKGILWIRTGKIHPQKRFQK